MRSAGRLAGFLMRDKRSTEQRTPMQRPRPVMMISLRRCGSHAPRLRLNMSPDFYSPYPLHILDLIPLVPLYGDWW